MSMQQATSLLDLYIESYELKYSKRPEINSYKDKYGFMDMLRDHSFTTCCEIVNYYFELRKIGHPLKHLFSHYHQMHTNMIDEQEDAIRREQLREETKSRAENWIKHE